MMESQYLTPLFSWEVKLYLFCIVANEIVWTQGNVNFQLPGFGSLPSLQHRWYHWCWWRPKCMVTSAISISTFGHFWWQQLFWYLEKCWWTHLCPVSGGECPAPKGAQGGGADTGVAIFALKLSLITDFQSLQKVWVFLRSKTNSLAMRNREVLNSVFNHHLKISCNYPNN